MRIAIVDDLETERALLKTRLERQLNLRGAEAEILEFDSGESFLEAEKEQRFTAAFLDIYMEGLSGMDAARELRKTDADCLLVFTTTSTDHALEGFQVRALHYLVKPFSEEELSGLLAEMLAKLPRLEPVLTVKVSGSDVRLRYRDIVSAEHFAHMINIRTTAGKTLATRQSFKAFTEPLKKDPRFFVCSRGVIVNLEHAADFQDAAFCMTDGSRVYVNQELLKPARQAFMEFLLQRGSKE
jgi:two-component system, LytTR family, response regulator LytT